MAIVGVTGHRPDRLGGYNYEAMTYLYGFAHDLLSDSRPDEMIIGMAQGWDMAVARACAVLKIPFTAAIPFVGQSNVWPPAARREYSDLLSIAKTVVTVNTGSYEAWKYLRRDEWIVDNSDEILALYKGGKGRSGTAYTIAYAKEVGTPVNNVWQQYGEWLNAA